uniref:Putative ovule protein n=1 Tax=Solanum chacoense TaxID=4108 RepID=A0A0V0I808_SOLCH
MEKSHIFIIKVIGETKEGILNRIEFTLSAHFNKILGITSVLQEVVEDEMSSIDCQNNPADNCHLFEEVIIHAKITSDNISAIFVT